MVSAAECYNRNGLPRFPVFRGSPKPKFLIPIQRQVNKQSTNTNANIVVSSAATTSKRQKCLLQRMFLKMFLFGGTPSMQLVNDIQDPVCDFPLLYPDTMHPNHLWHPLRSATATLTPLGVVIVFGGWVFVVSLVVFPSFKIKPPFANATTRSSNNYAACCDDVAKTQISSANLRSSKGPPPCSKSILSVFTRVLHLRRTHSNQ